MTELRGHTVRVYCWCCGQVVKRDILAGLLARCDVCGSADSHVIASLALSRYTREDVAEMAASWRAEFLEAARVRVTEQVGRELRGEVR